MKTLKCKRNCSLITSHRQIESSQSHLETPEPVTIFSPQKPREQPNTEATTIGNDLMARALEVKEKLFRAQKEVPQELISLLQETPNVLLLLVLIYVVGATSEYSTTWKSQ